MILSFQISMTFILHFLVLKPLVLTLHTHLVIPVHPPPSGMLLLPRQSSLDDLLKYPTLPEKPKVYLEMKKSSQVLTSGENLQLLQQKEKKKKRKPG